MAFFSDTEDELGAIDRRGDLFVFSLLPLLTRSAVTGVLAGAVVTLFSLLLELASELSLEAAAAARGNAWLSVAVVVVAAALGLAAAFWTKLFPEGRGSGVPSSEALARGETEGVWHRLCLSTLVGTALSFFAGVPVGAEGPAVQLGAGIGAGMEKETFRRPRPVVSAGIAAGITGAFAAPLAGVLFAVEETHRRFDSKICAAACMAAFYAFSVRRLLGGALGMDEVYFGSGAAELPGGYVWAAIAAGAVAALAAAAFSRVILLTDRLSKPGRLPRALTLPLLFGLSAVFLLFYPEVAGSGKSMIMSAAAGGGDALSALLAGAVKFVLVCLVFGVAPTGGMMVPMLAVGAALGEAFGALLALAGLPAECVPALSMITMCAFLGSGMCAPLTALALFVETTTLFESIPCAVAAVAVSAAVGRLLGRRPLYDALWERSEERRLKAENLPRPAAER